MSSRRPSKPPDSVAPPPDPQIFTHVLLHHSTTSSAPAPHIDGAPPIVAAMPCSGQARYPKLPHASSCQRIDHGGDGCCPAAAALALVSVPGARRAAGGGGPEPLCGPLGGDGGCPAAAAPALVSVPNAIIVLGQVPINKSVDHQRQLRSVALHPS